MSTPYQVTAGVTALRRTPADDGAMDTQLLAGEMFHVECENRGWGFGKASLDDYQGWVDMTALSSLVLIPTHTVSVLRTYVYSAPDLKSAPICLISLNAKIPNGRRSGRFIEAQRMGWVFEGHLRPVGDPVEPDWVWVAERFEHTPYLWGGKESLGLDCSGLIQSAMEAGGQLAPRDSGPQHQWVKAHWREVEIKPDFSGLRRGDLVFWPGHVGVMTDETHLLHANSFHMRTIKENLSRAVRRIAHHHAPLSGIYRAPGADGK